MPGARGRGGKKHENGGKRRGSTRQNASERVGDEEGPAGDDVDEPDHEVTNGDDLKRKLPGANNTGTAPKKKPKKIKGYVDPFSEQSKEPALQLVPEPSFSVAESERIKRHGGSTSGQEEEYINSPRTINTALHEATWIDPDLETAPNPGRYNRQQRERTFDNSRTHTVRPLDETLGSPFREKLKPEDHGHNHGGSIGTWPNRLQPLTSNERGFAMPSVPGKPHCELSVTPDNRPLSATRPRQEFAAPGLVRGSPAPSFRQPSAKPAPPSRRGSLAPSFRQPSATPAPLSRRGSPAPSFRQPSATPAPPGASGPRQAPVTLSHHQFPALHSSKPVPLQQKLVKPGSSSNPSQTRKTADLKENLVPEYSSPPAFPGKRSHVADVKTKAAPHTKQDDARTVKIKPVEPKHGTSAPDRPKCTIASLSANLKPSIPKAAVDQLNEHQAQLKDFHDQINELFSNHAAMEGRCRKIEQRNTQLKEENQALTSEIKQLREAQEESNREIASLRDEVHALGNRPDAAVRGVETEKERRNNALNTGIRKAFQMAMGITDTSDLPHPIPERGFFWVGTNGPLGRLVRPKWRESFANNSDWHKDILEFVRKNATNCWPAATKELLVQTNDAKLMACLRTTFKSWATQYKMKWKGIEDPEAAGEEGEDNNNRKKRDDQQNRRRGRKIKKAQERTDIRGQSSLRASKYDFLFDRAYQSTDESDNDSRLDSDTDSDQAVDVHVKERPWVSRPPNYRRRDVTRAVLEIDNLVQKKRKADSADKAGNRPHSRKRGRLRIVKMLPKPSKNGPKIPRWAIDPEWLRKNPDANVPSRILEQDVEVTQNAVAEPEAVEEEEVLVEEHDGVELGWEAQAELEERLLEGDLDERDLYAVEEDERDLNAVEEDEEENMESWYN